MESALDDFIKIPRTGTVTFSGAVKEVFRIVTLMATCKVIKLPSFQITLLTLLLNTMFKIVKKVPETKQLFPLKL